MNSSNVEYCCVSIWSVKHWLVVISRAGEPALGSGSGRAVINVGLETNWKLNAVDMKA